MQPEKFVDPSGEDQTSDLKVLILEDQMSDYLLLKRQFKTSVPNATLHHAESLAQATDAVGNLQFDGVVCDLNVPDGRGVDLVKFVRRFDESLPIIMLTGGGDEHAAVEAIKVGATDYLIKSRDSMAKLPLLLRAAIAERARLLEGQKSLAELNHLQERFRDFAEAASDWFWEKGPDLRFTYVDPSVRKALGLEPSYFIGKSLWEIVKENPPPGWRQHQEEVLEHRYFRDFTYDLPKPTGEERTILVSGKPVFAVDGQFLGYRGIGRDITDAVRTQREIVAAKDAAEKADAAKTQFLAVMSHELRTPLNAIIGFTEAMASGIAGPVTERQGEYLGDVVGAAYQLLNLVNDILDLSKIQTSHYEIHPETFEIASAIDAAVSLLRGQADKKRIKLLVDPIDAEIIVFADVRAFRQVLLNLLSNAVKFTPAEGTISVAARPARDGVAVSVTDTGIGIDPKKIDRVTEPFQQIANAFTRETSGTGLGLAIVKGLMEAHAGTLVIESELDKGTRVQLWFPSKPSAEHQT